MEVDLLAKVEKCCEQGDYKKALQEFDKSFISICNAEISENLRLLAPSNTDSIPVDDRYFWRSHKLHNQDYCTTAAKPLNTLMEEIKKDLQQTKQAQDSVLYFFGSDVEEEGRCIRSFIYCACIICSDKKVPLMKLWQNKHKETSARLRQAWKYNFFLLKVLVTCFFNAIHMKRIEEEENKIKGMQELQMTMYKHRLLFMNYVFAADIVKNSNQSSTTDCFFCKQTATTDSKINIYTGKNVPGSDNVVARNFVFCGKCVGFVNSFIFLCRYLHVLKFTMRNYSKEKGKNVSVQDYYEQQQITQVDSIRRSINDVTTTLAPGAKEVDDETVIAVAMKLGIGIFEPTDPVYNMDKIVPLDILYRDDMLID